MCLSEIDAAKDMWSSVELDLVMALISLTASKEEWEVVLQHNHSVVSTPSVLLASIITSCLGGFSLLILAAIDLDPNRLWNHRTASGADSVQRISCGSSSLYKRAITQISCLCSDCAQVSSSALVLVNDEPQPPNSLNPKYLKFKKKCN